LFGVVVDGSQRALVTPPVRVLVVDDSATIRRVVGSVLLRAGHEVATADSGERGLVEVGAFQPDIILLDFIMPGMNGYQFLKRLGVEHDGDEIPVVLMCTRGDQVPAVDGNLKAVGVVDVITKPFSPEALLAVVNHSLEKHGRRRPQRDTTRVVAALASIAPAEASDDGRDELFPPAFGSDDVTDRTVPVPIAGLRGSVVGATVVSGPLLLPPGVALCGDLTVIALPEVLQLLKFQAQTGLLSVDAAGLRFEMGLEQGLVVGLSAKEPDGSPARRGDLLLGRYFVAAGLVDDAALEIHLAQPGGKPIGERLVAAGVITPDELRRAVGDQTQDLMVELLRARRGVFALSAGASHLPAVVVRPGFGVDVLMFEALRQIDEWAVIESEVPSFEARFALRLSSQGGVDDSGLSAEEGAVLRQLKQGPLAVRDLVKRSPLRPFDVCRVLYRLAVLKRVRRIDDGDSSRLVSEDGGDKVPLLSTPPREAS
jgi:twitching motility two-component system response regulator PilH